MLIIWLIGRWIKFSLTKMAVWILVGGVLPSVVYIGIIQLFEKCFPVLPELSWLLDGAIGIVFPIVYAMFISDHVFATGRKSTEDKKSDVKSDFLALSTGEKTEL